MHFTFPTQGTCAQFIEGDIRQGRLYNVSFFGGCGGNLQAMARLVEGRSCEEVIALLQGIGCRNGTSCPDQLALALKQYCLEQAS
ncbi:MAG: TIGR03905 family TSCPD domain-containing protein [Geothermobacteraceae bacterium]